MKKFLQRVLGMVIAIIGFTYNLCYADLIDPNHPSLPRGEGNIVPMIIIGVVIAVIVVGAIIILAKSKKDKEKMMINKKF